MVVEGQAVLRTGSDAVTLFTPRLGHLDHEQVVVAFVDPGFRLMGLVDHALDPMHRGCRRVALPVRDIIRHALVLDAAGLILAHNHPSGDPTPSPADLAATRILADTARGLRIKLIDHLVIAGHRSASFRALGLL